MIVSISEYEPSQDRKDDFEIPVIAFNEKALEVINIIAIGSNTIILSFWVHSKYYFVDYKDNSSSIPKRSSIIVATTYVMLIIITGFRKWGTKIITKMIILRDPNLVFFQSPKLQIITNIFQFINSISFLLMVNFYFMAIKEVTLRKEIANYFKGKK